jgi:recombination protein RecA
MAEKKVAVAPSVLKRQLLREAVARLNSDKRVTGSQFVVADPNAPIPHVPSRNLIINNAIGGQWCPGWPRNAITEVFGAESCGKTTLAVQACVDAIAAGGTAAYLDFEFAINHMYARKLGLNLADPAFAMYQPSCVEDGAKCIREFLRCKVDILVVDSVAAMVPRKILDMDDLDEEEKVGLHAKRVTQVLRRIAYWQREFNSNTAVIFINQTRAKIETGGMPGKKRFAGASDVTTGGHALRFYASVRIALSVIKRVSIEFEDPIEKVKKKVPYHQTVQFLCRKNKVAPRQGWNSLLALRYGQGFDPIRSLLDLAIKHNIIEKVGGGSTLVYKDSRGKEVFRAPGIEALRRYFVENDDQRVRLEAAIAALFRKLDPMGSKQDDTYAVGRLIESDGDTDSESDENGDDFDEASVVDSGKKDADGMPGFEDDDEDVSGAVIIPDAPDNSGEVVDALLNTDKE